jgi:hypothetical protein
MMGPMAWHEWTWTWWRRLTHAPAESTAVAPRQNAPSRVAAQYLALYTYLERRYASNVVLTFEQMEALLGFALPACARTERDWWTSSSSDTDHHSEAWSVAQRTATPNLLARNVSFERQP